MVADYRTPTSEEGLCRQVLAWVWAEVADLPTEQQERILAPLRKEYQSMFGHPAAEMVSPLEAKP
jgi:predicted Abi (CAAX) family protease